MKYSFYLPVLICLVNFLPSNPCIAEEQQQDWKIDYDSAIVIGATEVDSSIAIPPFRNIKKEQVLSLSEKIYFPDRLVLCSYLVADVTGDGKEDLIFSEHSRGRGPCGPVIVLTKIGNTYYEVGIAGDEIHDVASLIQDLDKDGKNELIIPHHMEDNGIISCSPVHWRIYQWDSSKHAMVMVSAKYRSFFEKKAAELRKEIKEGMRINKANHQSEIPCKSRVLKVIEQQLKIWSGGLRSKHKMADLATGDPDDSIFDTNLKLEDVYNEKYRKNNK